MKPVYGVILEAQLNIQGNVLPNSAIHTFGLVILMLPIMSLSTATALNKNLKASLPTYMVVYNTQRLPKCIVSYYPTPTVSYCPHHVTHGQGVAYGLDFPVLCYMV